MALFCIQWIESDLAAVSHAFSLHPRTFVTIFFFEREHFYVKGPNEIGMRPVGILKAMMLLSR